MEDISKSAAQVGLIKVADVNAVDGDGALLNIIEATYQIDDGAFSGSGGTYNGEGLPGSTLKERSLITQLSSS